MELKIDVQENSKGGDKIKLIKKDHIDCWNNQYDQNNQHMKYVVTTIFYHMLIKNTNFIESEVYIW